MTTTTTIASPAKLRNGSWGARVQGTVSPGDVVTIRTKGGKTWDARVTSVVWAGEGVTLVATASLDRPAAAPVSSRGRWTGCSCGSIEDQPRKSDCRSCRFENFDQ